MSVPIFAQFSVLWLASCQLAFPQTAEDQHVNSRLDTIHRAASQKSSVDSKEEVELSPTGGSEESSSTNQSITFRDATRTSGIDFVHTDGSTGQNYLVEFMGAGVASLDFDRDGRLDLYFLNGHSLPQQNHSNLDEPKVTTNELYRNVGGLHFHKVTAAGRTLELGYGLGVTVGDYDGDGFEDIFINNFGRNELMRNNGDGTFVPVGNITGLSEPSEFGAGATFFDGDRDGNLDLFVGNYVDFSYEVHEKLAPQAYPFPPGPKDFPYLSDRYYVNLGNESFTDASQSSGLTDTPGPCMGVVAGDFDSDGLDDILAVSDGAANHLYRNIGRHQFTEDGVLFGVAYDAKGHSNGSMGVDAADYDGNGLSDLLVTTYVGQYPTLFSNLGHGFFEDSTRKTRIGTSVLPHVNWTAAFGDLDLDGDQDAFICNGHFLKNSAAIAEQTSFAVPNSIMKNTNASFLDVTADAGQALLATHSSRGAALDDFDLDGDLDVAILNCGDESQILENLCIKDLNGSPLKSQSSLWLQIDLVGTESNRDGIGAKVTVLFLDYAAESDAAIYDAERGPTNSKFYKGAQVRIRRGGRGYQSHYGSRLHFALPSALVYEKLEPNVPHQFVAVVQWPSGLIERFSPLAPNQLVTLIEHYGSEVPSPR